MLALEAVHGFYGQIEALKGISLRVDRGEIVALIGSNGAGKTTALLAISGVLSPRRGAVRFDGIDITGMPPHEIVKMGISHVPEGRRVFQKMTVRENLEMGAFLRRDRGIAGLLDKIYAIFPVLKDRQRQSAGTLSGGEQQMLAIGRALMSTPRLLLLDEPSLGLAPIMVQKIFKTIKEISEEGVTILLVEQNARAALNLSHRAYVIETGRIKLHGTGGELINDMEVKRAYLGE